MLGPRGARQDLPADARRESQTPAGRWIRHQTRRPTGGGVDRARSRPSVLEVAVGGAELMPSSSLSGKVAIVGVDESDRIGAVPDKSMLQLHAEGARNALRDAGLTLKDVDGLFTANISPAEVGEYLGIEPKYVDGTNVGGCSFLIHVAHAAAAIAEGRCSVVLITHGESGRSRVGLPPPAGSYALACSRHMAQYGTTSEQLAEIAVATRKWAALNPKAMFRDPL